MTTDTIESRPHAALGPAHDDRPPATSDDAADAAGARIAYVDALRALCLLGVFLIHVAEPFTPWDEWHIVNAERSRVIGEIVVLMAPWIMPLFMLLAGTTAWHSLQRRSTASYLRERVLRLLVPLVVGVLVLVPPQVWAERRLRGQFDGPLWAFYPRFFDGIYPRGNFAAHHLWFIAHLAAYALVTLPLFRYLQHARGQAQLRWLARACAGAVGLFWLSLPFVMARGLVWGLFHRQHVLTTDWADHGLLLVAYVYGFILAGEPGLGTDIDRQWRRAAAIGGTSTALFVAGTWVGLLPHGVPPAYTLPFLAFWTLYTIGAWSCMVALLGAARRWLRDARTPRYVRDTGFAWYLVHQTVIVVLAAIVVTWPVGAVTKFAVLTAGSLAGTLLAAEALRRVPVARAVFALRPPRRERVRPAPPDTRAT